MKVFFKITISLVILSVGLMACQKKELTLDKIHYHLNESVVIESEFESYQKSINELEHEEGELFNRIIEMTDDEKDDKQKIAEEAKQLLNDKKEEINAIQQMLKESKAEFEQIEPLINELEDNEQINRLEKMYSAMMDRYEASENVFDSYSISIELTNELYDHFLLEENHTSDIFSMIKKVNESYENITSAYDQFNDSTIAYNTLKTDFYELFKQE